MYNCEKVLGLINKYIDNHLNKEDIKQINSHLTSCIKCKEEYDLSIKIKNEMANLHQLDLPARFRSDLHNKLKDVNKQSNNIIKLLTSIAAVILIFVFSTYYFNFDAVKNYSYKSNKNLIISKETNTDKNNADSNIQSVRAFESSSTDAVPQYGITSITTDKQKTLQETEQTMQNSISSIDEKSNLNSGDTSENFNAKQAIPKAEIRTFNNADNNINIAEYRNKPEPNHFIIYFSLLMFIGLLAIFLRYRKRL